MASIWLTYAWADNSEGKVDSVIGQIRGAGLNLEVRRWSVFSDTPLWEQISSAVSDPAVCSAWVFYASMKNLGNKERQNALGEAFDAITQARGESFPIICLLGDPEIEEFIPDSTRVNTVEISETEWIQQIEVETVGDAEPELDLADGTEEHSTEEISPPYFVKVHNITRGEHIFAIELRPHGGAWRPFLAGIPMAEKEKIDPQLAWGPSNAPAASDVDATGACASGDKSLWLMHARNEASVERAYYVYCKALPSRLLFGVNGASPQFRVNLV